MDSSQPDEREKRWGRKRFPVRHTVYAILDSQPPGQSAAIVELHRTGADLLYHHSEEFRCTWRKVDLAAPDNFFLRDLPIELVSDKTVDEVEPGSSGRRLKRCEVKFIGLTFTQLALLEIFIRENTADDQTGESAPF